MAVCHVNSCDSQQRYFVPNNKHTGVKQQLTQADCYSCFCFLSISFDSHKFYMCLLVFLWHNFHNELQTFFTISLVIFFDFGDARNRNAVPYLFFFFFPHSPIERKYYSALNHV